MHSKQISDRLVADYQVMMIGYREKSSFTAIIWYRGSLSLSEQMEEN